jgi:hypothetical protein
LDGVISIEDEPKRMLTRHGLAVLDTLVHIAETALHAGEAPVLTLQCPAQLPPTNSFRDGVGGRVSEVARSSSMAIRFSLALERPSADVRLQIADRLARHCEDHGLGLWLSDTRPGLPDGQLVPGAPARPVDRPERLPAGGRAPAGQQRRRGLPAGDLRRARPARGDARHPVLPRAVPAVGVLACSMTVLDELTFLHVQLAVDGASRGRLASVNRALADLRTRSGDPAAVLTTLVQLLLPDRPVEPPNEAQVERLLARAGDYQTVLGPALPVVPDTAVRRVPIWVGWQMRKSEAGLRAPLLALHQALDLLGLVDGDVDRRLRPNIEYLICRQQGAALLRGKGKLAVARSLVEQRFPSDGQGTARLAAELREAWTARLRACGDDRFGEISVSSREFLLGEGQPRH